MISDSLGSHEKAILPRLRLMEGLHFDNQKELFTIIEAELVKLGRDPASVLLCGHNNPPSEQVRPSTFALKWGEVEYLLKFAEWGTPYDYAVYAYEAEEIGAATITIYDEAQMHRGSDMVSDYMPNAGLNLRDVIILEVEIEL